MFPVDDEIDWDILVLVKKYGFRRGRSDLARKPVVRSERTAIDEGEQTERVDHVHNGFDRLIDD